MTMTAKERASAIAHKWKNQTVWIGDLSADIEKAVANAEFEAETRERARCIELIKRCHKVYEREALRERDEAKAKGIQPHKIDDYEAIFVYVSDLEKRLCEKATACEYMEMVVKEWSLDSTMMPLPF